MKKATRLIVTVLLALAMVLTMGVSPKTYAATNLEVHIIDVGQADSIYIKLPNGQNMLIDGGNNEDGPTVVNYLKSRGVTTVDYVVGTHPHEDHIGGLDDVIKAFNIGKVYLPNKTSTTQTYTDLMNAIKAKGLTVTTAKQGVTVLNTTSNLKTLSVVMLSPISTTYSDVNDYSPIIRVLYGTTSFLFTGDAGTLPEQEVINSGQTLTANVLKIGHHGSTTATSAAFLDAVKPTDAVISVGTGNSYGHPNQETLDKLMARNINIFRTDYQGTIIYTSDGTTYTSNVAPWWKGAASSKNIVINEVMPCPSTTYTTEWIELYNPNSTAVDISGYQIDDIANGGGAVYTIPSGTSIPAYGYYVYQTSSGIFNNSGDDVRLIKPDGTEIDKLTYGSSAYDKSWYRIPNGGAWQSTQDSTPTKGAANQ